MKYLKLLGLLFTLLLLTLITQVGGILLLLSILLFPLINKITYQKTLKVFYKTALFICIYALATFYIIPFIAIKTGRTALPITETNHLKPLTFLTILLNRNYVKPELLKAVTTIALELNKKHPNSIVNYLDAGFPFMDGFPLLPHLSHNDGKKLDLAFCYKSAKTSQSSNDCPSFIGYGICEEPLVHEKNTAYFCANKGYWQYSFLKKIIPQGNKEYFQFDAIRTKTLVALCVQNKSIAKIFIEPHLQNRLTLISPKIRFHGCQAVRHDDHIHIQLK